MMRFIDIGKQIGVDDDWPRQFAFWNTVSGRFLDLNGNQVWESREEFISEMQSNGGYDVERFIGLLPKWVP